MAVTLLSKEDHKAMSLNKKTLEEIRKDAKVYQCDNDQMDIKLLVECYIPVAEGEKEF